MTAAWGIALAIWKFLNSPLGRILGVGGLCVAAWTYAEHRGAARIRAQWEAANRAAAEKVKEVDKTIGEKAGELDKTETAANEAADKRNQEARNAYVAALEKRAAACSPLTGEPLQRLRDIR